VADREPAEKGVISMGISLCIASGKGGVGKSTIAANLGIALNRLGIKTLVLDGDLEGASIGLIMGVDSSVASIHDYLAGRASASDLVVKHEEVEVIVGRLKLDGLRNVELENLKSIITDLSEKYEVVIVDSPAGLGRDAVTVISSCKAMLLVVNPDITSLSNALKTLIIAKNVGCSFVFTVVNKVGSKYDIPTEMVNDMLKTRIVGEIPEDPSVKKALAYGKPSVLHDSKSPFSVAVLDLAADLVGKEVKSRDAREMKGKIKQLFG